MKPFYITTSIAYPNAAPHIGYALELIQADFLARYYRMCGYPVYFQTGIDVHGLKIQRTAEKAGVSPVEFISQKKQVFEELVSTLQLSHDRFIQTNDPDHIALAQAFWKKSAEAGDIYKKSYRAWYDVKEEEFLGLVDEFPDSKVFNLDPQFIEMIDEENYFFRLSRYKDQIVQLITTSTYKIVPTNRATELLNFVEEKGLQDISISRQKEKLSWGVPVPGDENHVMYVWFDALTNYLTGVSKVDESGDIIPNEFWPASLHVVGKDIGRFHGLLWTGMLLSAGIAVPRELLIHGFLTSGGLKMSKSIGNVVDPLQVIAETSSDTVRWYLLKEVSPMGDADFTMERLREVYTSDLANDLGNLVSRVWTMCQKYTEGNVPAVTPEQVDNLEKVLIEEAWRNYHEAVQSRQINVALGHAHDLSVFCNRRIEEYKPWAMAKDPQKKSELEELLYELLEIIRHVALMVSPALVGASQTILQSVLLADTSPEWGGLKPGAKLSTEAIILFPKPIS